MRRIYTLFFYCSLPFIFLRLLVRSRKNLGYKQNLRERLGYLPTSVEPGGIWLHAVSVGESIAAIPLIKALQKKYPSLPIIITNTTPTGRERILATFHHEKRILNFYLPYDLPGALKRFLRAIQPSIAIIMETELWPNLFYYCHRFNIPLVLANARLSEKSAKGYQRIHFLTRSMMQQITLLAVQTQTEAERFFALGLDPSRTKVTGSIKFDLAIPEDLMQQAKALRQQWGEHRPIWIAASTHEGEEEQILAALIKIKQKVSDVLLVLVPRHPERFSKVKQACINQGLAVVSRSEGIACNSSTEVFLGDSMGELLLFYAASDIAFVGGSLIAKGGHNPLEPAAVKIPVLMGPHVFNFAAISSELEKNGAMKIVNSEDELSAAVSDLFLDPLKRNKMGEEGCKFVANNRGALQKHLELIEKIIGMSAN